MTTRLAEVEPSPDVFAAVMATGILSIAAHDHRYSAISETLGVLATLTLLALVALVAVARPLPSWDWRDPDVTLRLFTFVAACAVVDTRLSSNVWVLRGLGVVALTSWLVLIALSGRNMVARSRAALRDHARGAWVLASVGTSGLSIVMARVAGSTGHRWWLAIALQVWVAAICLYGLMAWLILWRAVNERQDRDGFEPDSWILMGGLAIATLAGDNIHALVPAWLAGPVLAVTVVTWVAATLWIPPLIYFGLRRISRHPTILAFAGVWWALVFPLGMYSVASYAMAAQSRQNALLTVSLVSFWDALAAWLIVVAAGLQLLWQRLTRDRA
ncbi:tellurite resistance/C4-dicarboxylate transporter family protein [Mycobacterium sp. E3198]|uniref:tellurite resistance/C4-dicarboxylate transporter family protein n=1 Tax=Mycobacterium sp. E3198 TaxID=1834143 RepID=UPI0008008690|nr:tellurite resistance/C4-dicarboxylate transporter family protein [Mycobacterium sp. E3198]OBG38776.1 C4-dicarboxylate ABC transporter [Mycobacterium sp. E3198]